jgi:hypothetical protein
MKLIVTIKSFIVQAHVEVRHYQIGETWSAEGLRIEIASANLTLSLQLFIFYKNYKISSVFSGTTVLSIMTHSIMANSMQTVSITINIK